MAVIQRMMDTGIPPEIACGAAGITAAEGAMRSFSAWSKWACRQKYDLDLEEWAALAREATNTKQVEIKEIGGAWAIVSGGLTLDVFWDREEARRQCQKMAWRWI